MGSMGRTGNRRPMPGGSVGRLGQGMIRGTVGKKGIQRGAPPGHGQGRGTKPGGTPGPIRSQPQGRPPTSRAAVLSRCSNTSAMRVSLRPRTSNSSVAWTLSGRTRFSSRSARQRLRPSHVWVSRLLIACRSSRPISPNRLAAAMRRRPTSRTCSVSIRIFAITLLSIRRLVRRVRRTTGHHDYTSIRSERYWLL
jgi:hypothetical protein